MGRVVRTIATDGNPALSENDSDVFISYDGCGCAGGMVTTIESEEITETDWNGYNPNVLGRKKQKIYQDILGRTIKTEVFNWNNTIYSTLTHQYNGRDQILVSRHFDGDDNSSTYQDTTAAYDGHRRLIFEHKPEQAVNRGTSFEYLADGRLSKDGCQRSIDELYRMIPWSVGGSRVRDTVR